MPKKVRRQLDPFEGHEAAEAARKVAGLVDGRHFSTYVAEVKALLKAGDDDAAARLLLRLVDAVEREGQIPLAGSTGVPTWYSDQLAAIYKRADMTNERALLVQRMTILDIKVQTSGQVKLAELRQAASRVAPRPTRAKGTGGQLASMAGAVIRAILGAAALAFFKKQ